MTDQKIIKRINAALAEEFELEIDELVPEAMFKEDLDLDSLDAVDMVIVLEQEFNIKIKKDETFKSIRSLGDLHAFILAKKDEAR
ncbi:phosphopantetheine-binding protein [Maridesulfovibrio hydrothermalis]|uniref:Acyl carrier protein n=1 Tax=Maridesulfovibrio hydrothermalis AM13 = DSM 14728 TaxID=1121451 RepID=L0R9K1_9BACT|nr:phosphopantetheine-binding protein [Maridesulfovibrio hydrothermalis]CCO23433.1 Acyl carrier protein 2 [Maridesulfovibrio hydrothermalis AM13 = DSM 14728]